MAYNRTSFKAAPEYDTGERWVIFWETRRPPSGNWSQAVEKSQAAAVERARHRETGARRSRNPRPRRSSARGIC